MNWKKKLTSLGDEITSLSGEYFKVNQSAEFTEFNKYKIKGVGTVFRLLSIAIDEFIKLLKQLSNTVEIRAETENKIKEITELIGDLCIFGNSNARESLNETYVKEHPVNRGLSESGKRGDKGSIGKDLSCTVTDLRDLLVRIEKISDALNYDS